jgi:hypothetical protein
MFQPPSFRQGMPESSAMDGNLQLAQMPDRAFEGSLLAIPGRWIPASMPE